MQPLFRYFPIFSNIFGYGCSFVVFQPQRSDVQDVAEGVVLIAIVALFYPRKYEDHHSGRCLVLEFLHGAEWMLLSQNAAESAFWK